MNNNDLLCDIVGCENEAEYVSPFSDFFCYDHMVQDAEEMLISHEEYDKINERDK